MRTCREHGHDYGTTVDEPISVCRRCEVTRDRTVDPVTFTFPVPDPPESFEPKYPQVEVPLSQMDGNGFFIVSNVRRELYRQAGVSEAERQEFFEEALSGDYDHLLQTCMRWVTVT